MSEDTTFDVQLDPEDVILLLVRANERLLGKHYLAGITRLEKLLFLLQSETSFEGVGRFFTFEAYNFGPFAKEVYEAVDFLESLGLIEVSHREYPSFYAAVAEEQLLGAIDVSDEDKSDEEVGIEMGATEKLFSLTEDGRTVANKLAEGIRRRRSEDIVALDGIVVKYGSMPLAHLIRYVYERYPRMTEKSIHPEARRLRSRS